jgi:hypothetical protein
VAPREELAAPIFREIVYLTTRLRIPVEVNLQLFSWSREPLLLFPSQQKPFTYLDFVTDAVTVSQGRQQNIQEQCSHMQLLDTGVQGVLCGEAPQGVV